jgi:hypothetical protein
MPDVRSNRQLVLRLPSFDLAARPSILLYYLLVWDSLPKLTASMAGRYDQRAMTIGRYGRGSAIRMMDVGAPFSRLGYHCRAYCEG